MAVTAICDVEEVDEIQGTRVLLLFLCTLLQTVVTVYVLYETGMHKSSQAPKPSSSPRASRPRPTSPRSQGQQPKIDTGLKCCLWIYHISVLIHFILQFLVYWDALFNGTDASGNYSCYSNNFLFFPPCFYFLTFCLFWHLRLKIVFQSSSYRVSRRYFIGWIFAIISVTGLGICLILAEFVVMARTTSSNGMNAYYCIQNTNTLDFFPFLSKSSDTWTDIDVFKDCHIQSDKGVMQFASVILVVLGVPLVMFVTTFQYVRRMYDAYAKILNQDDSDFEPTSRSGSNLNRIGSRSPTGTPRPPADDVVDVAAASAAPGPTGARGGGAVPSVGTTSLQSNASISSATGSTGSVGSPASLGSSESAAGFPDTPDMVDRDENGGGAGSKTVDKIKKWGRQLSSLGTTENDNEIKRKQMRQIFRNGIIALVSAVSTFLSFVLYMINPGNMAVLIYFAAVVNGVLMLAVFQFGGWIFDILIVKGCLSCCGRGRKCKCCRCCAKVHGLLVQKSDVVKFKHVARTASKNSVDIQIVEVEDK